MVVGLRSFDSSPATSAGVVWRASRGGAEGRGDGDGAVAGEVVGAVVRERVDVARDGQRGRNGPLRGGVEARGGAAAGRAEQAGERLADEFKKPRPGPAGDEPRGDLGLLPR